MSSESTGVKKFMEDHPDLVLMGVLALTVVCAGLKAYAASKRSESSSVKSSQEDFVSEEVRFIDGSIAYTTPNHTTWDLIQDNYDLYN